MVVIVAPPCETTVISPGPPNTIRGVRVARSTCWPGGIAVNVNVPLALANEERVSNADASCSASAGTSVNARLPSGPSGPLTAPEILNARTGFNWKSTLPRSSPDPSFTSVARTAEPAPEKNCVG